MSTPPKQPHLFYGLEHPKTLKNIADVLTYISWQTQCQIASNNQPPQRALNGLCYLCDELSLSLDFMSEALAIDSSYDQTQLDNMQATKGWQPN